jgi:hypothetical protein
MKPNLAPFIDSEFKAAKKVHVPCHFVLPPPPLIECHMLFKWTLTETAIVKNSKIQFFFFFVCTSLRRFFSITFCHISKIEDLGKEY